MGKADYAIPGGQVQVNDHDVPDLAIFGSQVGFVPQDDIMHSELTVKQVLFYQAHLRLPSDMDIESKKRTIEDVMLVLDLDQIQHSVVGGEGVRGISGGQKKRVNIAMELVAYPTVVF